MVPALRTVRKTLIPLARERGLALSGFLSLPAAVALGSAFVETAGVAVDWLQAGQPTDAPWSLSATSESVPIEVEFRALEPRAYDIGVLVSITDDVEAPFGATMRQLPSLRTAVHVSARSLPLRIESAGQAAALARAVRDAIRQARRDYGATGTVHLFLAVPAGIAVLLGQLLNTLGRVQTYDFQADRADPYSPAVALDPSA